MAITISNAARTAAVTALTNLLDASSVAGYITVTASNDDVLTTHALSDPAVASITNGVATLDTIADDTDAAGGTAAKVKFYDGDAVLVMSGTATATGGGGDLELNSLTIPAAVTVSITSGTITMPATPA